MKHNIDNNFTPQLTKHHMIIQSHVILIILLPKVKIKIALKKVCVQNKGSLISYKPCHCCHDIVIVHTIITLFAIVKSVFNNIHIVTYDLCVQIGKVRVGDNVFFCIWQTNILCRLLCPECLYCTSIYNYFLAKHVYFFKTFQMNLTLLFSCSGH